MVAHHYPELLSFFSRSLGDRDAAADVVQEAYARVLKMYADGTVAFDPRALLFRTGKNLTVSDVRRRAAEERMLQTLRLVSSDSAPSVEQQVDARQQLERLLARMSAMPRRRREAFILVRIYGYSYAEAGEFMGVSSFAVDRHVVRGVLDCVRRRAV
ncbi:sigma-70 family RNA polymerase sigma factor [Verticiella sediminum]|uniref:Sigma-70 family RNA polymerase sigma factor n=1 Tax=Verticiella sediminum TaxID=1247510 RepID=A0A556A939_9BURK|nr:sigma-70 family RNA polymerase sigma factor [Verticiella sediminum]TSH89406.1 sigma-70 family RNA polymerase sigma factor [Verticiella sediminum]